MNAEALFSWNWRKRSDALVPQAAIAWGDASDALHERVAGMSSEQLGNISLTANLDVMVAIGAAVNLPWVPGVAYAAPCPDAPALWLPTCWQPDIPCDLLAQALTRLCGRHPLLLWNTPPTLFPLDRVLPATPALLASIERYRQRI